MIKNWDYKNLKIDYSSYFGQTYIHPLDLDLFYISTNGYIVLGEIKNERYKEKSWLSQRKYIEKLLKRITGESIFIFITHSSYVQKGDTKVNVSLCEVKEYWYKGKWVEPKNKLLVKDVFEKYPVS